MFQVYIGVFLKSLKKRSEVNNTKGCNLNSTVGIESFCLGTVVEPTHLEQILYAQVTLETMNKNTDFFRDHQT